MGKEGPQTSGSPNPQERGLIGLLISERDKDLVPEVFSCLSKALKKIDAKVDMVLSLSPEDEGARKATESFKPMEISEQAFLTSPVYLPFLMKILGPLKAGNCDMGLLQDLLLQNISDRRNLIREYAIEMGYDWLFFLDSDVCLNDLTLCRLLDSKKSVVYAPYQPRWSAHVAVGVLGEDGQIKILLNPHLIMRPDKVFLAAVIGMGATLLRKDVLDQPFMVDGVGNVRGEDVGYCLNLLRKGIPIYCLSGHFVDHKCQRDEVLPNISDGPSTLSLRDYQTLQS